MKININEYKIPLIIIGIIILGLISMQFGFADLVSASLTDDEPSSWEVVTVKYEKALEGNENVVVIYVYFLNNKPVYDELTEEEAICESFTFTFDTESLMAIETKRDIEVSFNDFHPIMFSIEDVPDDYKGNVMITAYGYDENDYTYVVQEVLVIPIEIPTPAATETPGFEAVFAIAGLLSVIYLIKRE